jgi:hypothetical protein
MLTEQETAICREITVKLPGKRSVQYLSLLWPP